MGLLRPYRQTRSSVVTCPDALCITDLVSMNLGCAVFHWTVDAGVTAAAAVVVLAVVSAVRTAGLSTLHLCCVFRYAKDLHELHQLLNSQRVTSANKDKINSFMHRTTQVTTHG